LRGASHSTTGQFLPSSSPPVLEEKRFSWGHLFPIYHLKRR
jgi:hypothetical protein